MYPPVISWAASPIVSLIIGFTFSSYLLNMPAAAGSGLMAFEYGKAIGIADLELDKESKDIVKKSAEIQYIDQYPPVISWAASPIVSLIIGFTFSSYLLNMPAAAVPTV
jgi:phosphate/sulfate permease